MNAKRQPASSLPIVISVLQAAFFAKPPYGFGWRLEPDPVARIVKLINQKTT
jgi:hypothetical protein